MLTFKDVGVLHDGAIQEAFDDACRDLAFDCKERPLLNKDRVVRLVLLVRPVVNGTGECYDVSVMAAVKHRIPTHHRRGP